MSGRITAFWQDGGGGAEMESAGEGCRKRPAPAAAGGDGGVAEETHEDGPESKRERVDQGEAGGEGKGGGEELPEARMDLDTEAVAKEDVDRRVEREEVEDELKDLQHLVKTRGYIAQLEQENHGLWEALGSAGHGQEAPEMQKGGMEGDNVCPTPTLAGKKRQREEDEVQGGGDASKSMRTALGDPRQAAGVDSAGPELPDADLGSGPRWDLRPKRGTKQTLRGKDMDALQKEVEGLRKRCEAMLEQALSGSEHGDVRFVLKDGSSPFSGHRAVLCAVSEEYASMFRSGMVEAQKGKIRVPPGVRLQAYRGLLEFVYLGRAEKECAKADGRELWVLGEMYEVAGMREWLLGGIHGGNFGAAYEFGLVPEGVEREGIMAKCMSIVQEEGHGEVDEVGLRGVGREAARGLALARVRHGEKRKGGWRYVRDGFRVFEGWVRANGGETGGGGVSWFRKVVGELDLLRIPLDELRKLLRGCGYLDGVWITGVLERKQAAGENLHDVEIKTDYKLERQYDLGGDFGRLWGGVKLALHGEGSEQRMAVIDRSNNRVVIVNVESGERLATVGSEGGGPGEFSLPYGVAFSDAGELYVCSMSDNGVQVFDRQGRYVRGFGKYGKGEGQFTIPTGLCFTSERNLVVIDKDVHRVQIYREDETFVRAFGSKGSGDGEFQTMTDVCSGADGSIVILDEDAHRVQVFEGEGVFLRSFGSKGNGPGQFERPISVAAGRGGEIIVSDGRRKDVQIFSPEGELLQTITTESLKEMSTIQGRASRVYRLKVAGVATADGVMFVAIDWTSPSAATVAMLS